MASDMLKHYSAHSSIPFFAIVEIVLACLLPTLLTICEDQGSETQLDGFTNLVFLVVRIVDEALLPMHLVCVVFFSLLFFPFRRLDLIMWSNHFDVLF